MDIHGTWKLKSCIARSSKGETHYPYGNSPVGQLIYASQGRMSVILMDSQRRPFASHDLSQARLEEKSSAFDSFDAYSGSYEVDAQNKKIIHHIEAGRVPNWINQDHVRHYKTYDDTLVLLTEPFEMREDRWQVEVIWLRL